MHQYGYFLPFYPFHIKRLRPQELIDNSTFAFAAFSIAIEHVTEEAFYKKAHRDIFLAMEHLFQKGEAIDMITLSEEMKRLNYYQSSGGAAYLSTILEEVHTSANIEHYARIVFRLSVMRNLISAGRQIEEIGYTADPDVEASLNRAEDILYQLSHGESPLDFVHIKNVLAQYLETSPVTDTGSQRSMR